MGLVIVNDDGTYEACAECGAPMHEYPEGPHTHFKTHIREDGIAVNVPYFPDTVITKWPSEEE